MLEIDGKSLALDDFRAVVLEGRKCGLAAGARQAVLRGRQVIEAALEKDTAIYGVNTGFGDLANVRIAADKLRELQRRLILSHAAGVGAPLPAVAVRGMLLLRANTLAQGHSGVRPEILDALLALLNHDVLPVVPSRGSVGASGDLAPLAHLALPLLGHGWVRVNGRRLAASAGLAQAGLVPLELGPKEGLALINGTQATTCLLALAALDARHLVQAADLIGALSTEALRGTDAAFDARLHALRPFEGQRVSAANLWRLMQGSEIRESHRHGDLRVQDPYCVRCMPQVHGAVRDVLSDGERRLAVEMNSVTDNPLVFPDAGDILSGGNFHAEAMALAADSLALALAELGSISERRLEKLNNAAFSGLPPFLIKNAGLNSGFMMAQVTAAALVSENKILCYPASADSIPTSADKEDHVSMGMGAALKLRQIVANTRQILAIELVAAAQGIDLLRPLRSSPALESLHAALRREIPSREEDREMAADLALGLAFVREKLAPHLEPVE